jgi:integrase
MESRLPVPVSLITETRDNFEAALSPSTRRAYASGWKHFTNWCESIGFDALPARPETVAMYLSGHADRLSVRTLRLRIVAIRRQHRLANEDDPVTHQVREVMRGLTKRYGQPPTRKAPLLTIDVQNIVSKLPDTVRGKRDRALILVGFAGALRRSEIVGLDVSDVEFTNYGLKLMIRGSKTDLEREGQPVAIIQGDHAETCPVRALAAWIDASGVQSGPLFRGIMPDDRVKSVRMSDRTVAKTVKRLAESVGLDKSRFGGHSLRAGCVTQAYRNGQQERVIAKQTRHRSVVVLRTYEREARLDVDNVSRSLGL